MQIGSENQSSERKCPAIYLSLQLVTHDPYLCFVLTNTFRLLIQHLGKDVFLLNMTFSTLSVLYTFNLLEESMQWKQHSKAKRRCPTFSPRRKILSLSLLYIRETLHTSCIVHGLLYATFILYIHTHIHIYIHIYMYH